MKKIIPQQCVMTANRRLDKVGLYWSMTLDGFTETQKIAPGHFVHVKTAPGADPYFRRAFSIADYDPGTKKLEIIYKTIGRGTTLLSHKKPGDEIDLIGPLGTTFSPVRKNRTAVLVAGGVGFPPLYFLAKHLLQRGHAGSNILFFYGGRNQADLVERQRIKKLGVTFIPCTDDGTLGQRGFVTAAVAEQLTHFEPSNTMIFGCGPEPMLAALQTLAMERGFSGELSLEAPMPCGVGVCLGCIKPTLANPREYVRVCHDGPIFKLGEVQL